MSLLKLAVGYWGSTYKGYRKLRAEEAVLLQSVLVASHRALRGFPLLEASLNPGLHNQTNVLYVEEGKASFDYSACIPLCDSYLHCDSFVQIE